MENKTDWNKIIITNEQKKDALKKISNFQKARNILNNISILIMFGSPFVFIWFDWILFLKILSTGIILQIIVKIFSLGIKNVNDQINGVKTEEDNSAKTSKFQQRLEAMAEQRKNK